MTESVSVRIELREPTSVGDLRASYDKEHRSLVRLATLLVGDQWTAEELVQDSFARLLERPPGLVSPATLDAYVRSTVLNACRSKVRRLIVERKHRERKTAPPHQASNADELPDQALRDALLALPIRQRQCVALRYYDDQTVDSIAELLGVSAGSVKTHIHRGLQRLRALLEDVE